MSKFSTQKRPFDLPQCEKNQCSPRQICKCQERHQRFGPRVRSSSLSKLSSLKAETTNKTSRRSKSVSRNQKQAKIKFKQTSTPKKGNKANQFVFQTPKRKTGTPQSSNYKNILSLSGGTATTASILCESGLYSDRKLKDCKKKLKIEKNYTNLGSVSAQIPQNIQEFQTFSSKQEKKVNKFKEILCQKDITTSVVEPSFHIQPSPRSMNIFQPQKNANQQALLNIQYERQSLNLKLDKLQLQKQLIQKKHNKIIQKLHKQHIEKTSLLQEQNQSLKNQVKKHKIELSGLKNTALQQSINSKIVPNLKKGFKEVRKQVNNIQIGINTVMVQTVQTYTNTYKQYNQQQGINQKTQKLHNRDENLKTIITNEYQQIMQKLETQQKYIAQLQRQIALSKKQSNNLYIQTDLTLISQQNQALNSFKLQASNGYASKQKCKQDSQESYQNQQFQQLQNQNNQPNRTHQTSLNKPKQTNPQQLGKYYKSVQTETEYSLLQSMKEQRQMKQVQIQTLNQERLSEEKSKVQLAVFSQLLANKDKFQNLMRNRNQSDDFVLNNLKEGLFGLFNNQQPTGQFPNQQVMEQQLSQQPANSQYSSSQQFSPQQFNPLQFSPQQFNSLQFSPQQSNHTFNPLIIFKNNNLLLKNRVQPQTIEHSTIINKYPLKNALIQQLDDHQHQFHQLQNEQKLRLGNPQNNLQAPKVKITESHMDHDKLKNFQMDDLHLLSQSLPRFKVTEEYLVGHQNIQSKDNQITTQSPIVEGRPQNYLKPKVPKSHENNLNDSYQQDRVFQRTNSATVPFSFCDKDNFHEAQENKQMQFSDSFRLVQASTKMEKQSIISSKNENAVKETCEVSINTSLSFDYFIQVQNNQKLLQALKSQREVVNQKAQIALQLVRQELQQQLKENPYQQEKYMLKQINSKATSALQLVRKQIFEREQKIISQNSQKISQQTEQQ